MHIIEAQQFDRVFLETLFAEASTLKNKTSDCMRGKILASLFYEPSTRTRLSFESAARRVGGQVVGTENAHEFSSAVKGESLEDTIRIIGGYADVIVLRHNENDAAGRAERVSSVPIINAGCGTGQHPTQGLLDLYTIWHECKKIDGLTIALAGDLKFGRTVRSLAYLLGKFDNVQILFVSPKELRVGGDIKEYLDRHRVAHKEVATLEEIIGDVDVLYQTRIQTERMQDKDEAKRLQAGAYRIDKKLASKMRLGAIIMHPLPRNDEIAPEVDELPSAAYFRQAQNGLYVRMALLQFLLEK
ncbi:MAG: aspartate carbamoyltransferase [bacterium]|nr:aspartate carbamoyltransferase [bacterium]